MRSLVSGPIGGNARHGMQSFGPVVGRCRHLANPKQNLLSLRR